MTRPLRIVYQERAPEPLAKGELPTAALEALAQDLLTTIKATGVAFAQRQSDQVKRLVCLASVGRSAPPPGAHVDPESGISGRCVREGRTQKSYDTLIDPRVDDSVCQQLGIRSLAAVPLLHRSQCMGLIEAFSDRPGHFDDAKLREIELTASRIGELLGFEAVRSTPPDSNPDPILKPADLNLMIAQDSRGSDFEEHKPFSIVESESGPSVTDQRELSAKSKRRMYRVIPALVLLTVVFALIAFIVPRRDTPPLSPRTANQRIETSTPNPTPATSPAPLAATTLARPSETSASAATPKRSLVERAEGGEVAAPLALANQYQEGHAVPRDLVRAITWYILAGANGNAQAKQRSVQLTRSVTPFEIGQIRYSVGRMYGQGIGVKLDYVSAYAWLELAKAQGQIRAEGEEHKLQSSMTAGQIAKAKARAAEWLKLHRRDAPVTGER